jgi:hypothetical protein
MKKTNFVSTKGSFFGVEIGIFGDPNVVACLNKLGAVGPDGAKVTRLKCVRWLGEWLGESKEWDVP